MLKLISKEKELGLFNRISNYRNDFRNWPVVALRSNLNMFPFDVILKTGSRERIENWRDLIKIKLKSRFGATLEGDFIKFYFQGKELKFNWENGKNGDLAATFIDEDYRILDFASRDVVDVGANIGDTAIYFSLLGSKRVIALEPFFHTFKLASENIRLNQLENIELLNAGLSNNDGFITLDREIIGNIGSRLVESEKGEPTELLSLETLMERYNLAEPVIKMDCEGCEYKALLNTPNDVIASFKQIMVEFHNGYRNIEAKLKSAGFEVVHTKDPIQGLLLGNNTNFT